MQRLYFRCWSFRKVYVIRDKTALEWKIVWVLKWAVVTKVFGGLLILFTIILVGPKVLVGLVDLAEKFWSTHVRVFLKRFHLKEFLWIHWNSVVISGLAADRQPAYFLLFMYQMILNDTSLIIRRVFVKLLLAQPSASFSRPFNRAISSSNCLILSRSSAFDCFSWSKFTFKSEFSCFSVAISSLSNAIWSLRLEFWSAYSASWTSSFNLISRIAYAGFQFRYFLKSIKSVAT